MQPTTHTPTAMDRAVVDDVIASMGHRLDEIAHDLTDEIHEHIAEIDDELYESTYESTRANLAMIRAMLRDGTRATVATPPPEALAYASEFVRRGTGLDVLQHAYRVAQARLTHVWLEDVGARTTDAGQLAGSFQYLNDWLFAWVEALEGRLLSYYSKERERWLRGTSAVRVGEIRTILDGVPVEASRSSARLRYELDRRHVAWVIWTDDGELESRGEGLFTAMEHLAGTVATLTGASDHLAVPLGRHLACWGGFREEPQLAAVPPDIPVAACCGLHIAMGDAGTGVAGFRRSYEEAMLARRVARVAHAPAGVSHRYGDVALDALLTENRDEAERFVHKELGSLAERGTSTDRLRETASVFLDERCSYRHAAARLGVHENTVAYRMRRFEQLLGRDVKTRQLELQTALRLVPLVTPTPGQRPQGASA